MSEGHEAKPVRKIGSEVHRAREQLARTALTRFGVNGVGIGLRTVAGATTDEVCVRVMVTRKRRESYLSSSEVLPKSISAEGRSVRVDVVQSGPFFPLAMLTMADELRLVEKNAPVAAAAPSGVYNGRYRPATSGVSLGHVDITAGTLGCLATDTTDQSTVVVSNNHVLANINKGKPGDSILQPGPIDGGTSADVVATLKRFVTIDLAGTNTVDAAAATPTSSTIIVNKSAADPSVAPVSASHPLVGLLFAGDCSGTILCCVASSVQTQLKVAFAGVAAPTLGMVVEKVGRTTGWTVGQIREVATSARVGYGNSGLVQFTDLFTIPGFGQGGDSGSAVLKAADQP